MQEKSGIRMMSAQVYFLKRAPREPVRFAFLCRLMFCVAPSVVASFIGVYSVSESGGHMRSRGPLRTVWTLEPCRLGVRHWLCVRTGTFLPHLSALSLSSRGTSPAVSVMGRRCPLAHGLLLGACPVESLPIGVTSVHLWPNLEGFGSLVSLVWSEGGLSLAEVHSGVPIPPMRCSPFFPIPFQSTLCQESASFT